MLFHVPLPVSPVPHMCSVVFLRVLVTGMYCFVSSGAALYRPVCSLGLAGGPSFCTASPLLTLGLFCSIALLSSPRNRSIELRNVSVHSSIHPASIHQVPVRCQALGRDRHAFTELQPGGGGRDCGTHAANTQTGEAPRATHKIHRSVTWPAGRLTAH